MTEHLTRRSPTTQPRRRAGRAGSRAHRRRGRRRGARRVERLDERPVDEHVAVFERAHEQLRAALDADRRPASRAPRPDRCRRDACGWTPSWSAAAWPARASTPAELIAAGRVSVSGARGRPSRRPAVDHRRRDRGRARTRTGRTTSPAAGTSWPARWRRSSPPGWWSPAGAAWTRAPRPAASPTCCCAPAPREVVAVDVGYGQLAWPLRQDERVRGARPHQRPRARPPRLIGGPVDLVVGDLSFISPRAGARRR